MALVRVNIFKDYDRLTSGSYDDPGDADDDAGAEAVWIGSLTAGQLCRTTPGEHIRSVQRGQG
jgi:hypothetical protein